MIRCLWVYCVGGIVEVQHRTVCVLDCMLVFKLILLLLLVTVWRFVCCGDCCDGCDGGELCILQIVLNVAVVVVLASVVVAAVVVFALAAVASANTSSPAAASTFTCVAAPATSLNAQLLLQ